MHFNCTFVSPRYYTPTISMSTDLASFEARFSLPYIRDKYRTFKLRRQRRKAKRPQVSHELTTPLPQFPIKKLLPSSVTEKRVAKRQRNTDLLLHLLSIYPIAASIASHLNKAELEALFSPKCCRQIFYHLRYIPNAPARSPSTTSLHQHYRKIGHLFDNKSSSYKTAKKIEARDTQAYYLALLGKTRECEKCADASARYVPMLLDMGLTYQLYSVLQGITTCYMCKKSYCHACLIRFFVQGDPRCRNTIKAPRHCCENCLPKVQSLLGRRIGQLYRGPNELDLIKWKIQKAQAIADDRLLDQSLSW